MAVPRRILVYGVTGSGKSTLARRIGSRLGLPYHSIDDLTWEPGWVPVPIEEQRRRIAALCAEETWVIDAAYGAWTDLALARAELVVGLDFPRWVSLSRLIRRTVVGLIRRTRICNDNVESLRILLSKDSPVLFHFQSFPRKRERMRRWQADPALPPVLLFRSPAAAERWLDIAHYSARDRRSSSEDR
ncbi:adenylate kinase [Actinoplanes aureus]|uniref:Adenylate kinase n=1 Tax=Actinoplanes aureus TaxID=2792083 RepID=A0A931CE53_9ACTN|nr:adenylate kinase [Actinoplanes aureus]MBG0568464.1 adenylate kinase [Actinoplanes aureus]